MAKVIAVMSPKGGVGKTFISYELGIALSKLGHHVLVIDTNIYAANLSLYMGFSHTPTTFNDVIKFSIPPENAIYKFSPSLSILPATTHVEIEDLNFGTKFLRNLLFKLSPKFDYIILDTEPGFTKNNESIIQSVEDILLVSTPDIPTLMTTHKLVLLLNKFGVKKTSLILNKVMKAYYELSDSEIKELMGVDVILKVPFSKQVVKAVSLRLPLEKGRVFNLFMNLAAKISGTELKKKSFFSFLRL